jgi:hypothetical protein
MKTYLFSIIFLAALHHSATASFDTLKIPIQRQRFHDKVNEEQKQLDKADGKEDGIIKASANEDITLTVTDAMMRRVNELQNTIERSLKIKTNNEKVRYLTYVEQLVRSFRNEWRARKINVVYAPLLVENFEKIMLATADSLSMVPYIDAMPYEAAKICSDIFVNNRAYNQCRTLVYFKYCALYPDKVLLGLSPFVKEPYADSVVNSIAQKDPGQLYKFAQDVSSPVGRLIKNSSNSLVKTIATLSSTPGALLYFPFLDDIQSGKKNIDSLKKIIGDGELGYDSVKYYKALVQTEISYSRRMSNGDTAVALFGANGLRDMLKRKALQHFVTPINDLHEKPENVRMRAVDLLTPVDLYYMMVMGESDIYTSSYKYSFTRMLQRLGKKPATDTLLLTVNYDYFKKFIKMAANFNRLDTFLSLMPAPAAESLMKSFVANLEKSNSLEDAVDVADSYSSISKKSLQANILSYVNDNEQRCIKVNNKRGKIIYNILKTIFLSADSTNNIDISTALGIPPVYSMDNKAIADDSGRIVQQVFFYGDEDGKQFFPSYINAFATKDWKIDNNNKEWVEIKSASATPRVLIYVNRPLNNDKNLDDSAQVHLNTYLRKNNLTPTVITHRGHSYWLPRTIDRMPGDAKIILLGSCGGYKNLSKLIEQNPEAHIISTKQIGTGNINQVITNALNQNFLTGKPLVWKNLWGNMAAFFAKQPKDTKDTWEDYVPPYKNLGAIFLKAYNKRAEVEQ